jgi:hypothetical protein
MVYRIGVEDNDRTTEESALSGVANLRMRPGGSWKARSAPVAHLGEVLRACKCGHPLVISRTMGIRVTAGSAAVVV